MTDGTKRESKSTAFRVVIEGGTLPGFDPDDVRERFAALVKQSEELAARLLSGQSSTVKSRVNQATAIRYFNALRGIGVACRVERETLDVDVGHRTADVGPPAHLQIGEHAG